MFGSAWPYIVTCGMSFALTKCCRTKLVATGLDERCAGEMNDSIKNSIYFGGGYSGMSVQMHQKSEPVLEFGLDDRSEVI